VSGDLGDESEGRGVTVDQEILLWTILRALKGFQRQRMIRKDRLYPRLGSNLSYLSVGTDDGKFPWRKEIRDKAYSETGY
jgi:hypothetical protein